MKKFLFLIAAMFVAVMDVSAQKIKFVDGFRYVLLDNGTARLDFVNAAKVNQNHDEITIPEFITKGNKTYKVTQIWDVTESPFRGVDVKKLILPKTLEYFNFKGCNGIEEIVFSDSMELIIPEYAFSYCKGLKKIHLPKRLKKIGANAFFNCNNLQSVEIPDGTERIGNWAFYGCSNLQYINIPNTVNYIGFAAFAQCVNLKKIIFPDNEFECDKSRGGNICDIFINCSNIEEIEGHNIKYPHYIIDYYDSTIRKNPDTYYKYNSLKKRLPYIKSSFAYFAQEKIIDRVRQWQKKKEYETTAQWRSRVTEENQKAQLAKVTEEVRQEYIEQFKPKLLSGTLGSFDADYNTYPVTISGIENTLYAQVPLGEAQNFKANWSKVKMTPQYGIVDDHVGVLSCTFALNGKTYQSARNYSNDSRDNLAINLPPIELYLGNDATTQPSAQPTIAAIDNSIDTQIPTSSAHNEKTFAVVIGNENYQRVAKVQYAKNDAKVFSEYCQKTLGLPAKNIRSYTDATYGTMLSALKDIKSIADAYNGDLNVIFYYAGHGVPDGTGKAYLLPVDADGTQTEVCLATTKLYKELAALQARSVVVFMDACFSGARRGEGMITAARGVALKAKSDTPEGNCVVFSAANGEETAFPYNEKGHGMFTYFLLKKLQETKGDVTLGELGEYIQTNVKRQSAVVNRKPQTPTVVHSISANNWNTMKLR